MKYHDADWHVRVRPLGFRAWRSKQDGAWAIGLLGFSLCRLHRDDPLEWSIGPFVRGNGHGIKVARVAFIPAHKNAQ